MASDAQAIYQAVFPAAAQRNIRDSALIQSDIAGGYITKYTSARPQDCAQAKGYVPTGVQVSSKIGGTASTVTAGTGLLAKVLPFVAPIPVVGQIVAGIAAVATTIFGFIGAHHTQAVAREQGTLCTAVPQFNADVAQVETEVNNGTISATDADTYIDQAVSNFDASVAGISQESGNTCNAGCVMRYEVEAVATDVKGKLHNSPTYYLKHYWWVGAIAVVILFFRKGR